MKKQIKSQDEVKERDSDRSGESPLKDNEMDIVESKENKNNETHAAQSKVENVDDLFDPYAEEIELEVL